MKIRYLFALLMMMFMTTSNVCAQMVHVIIFTNTIDESIGNNMKIDRARFQNEMQTIMELMDCDFQFYDYTGRDCTRQNLLSLVNKLNVDRDDAIIFFYGGHGTRSPQEKTDMFPQMCMDGNNPNNFVAVSGLANELWKKGPRLLVTVTNCCNNEVNGVGVRTLSFAQGGPTETVTMNADNYKRLFLEAKGKYMLTGSKAGLYSLCNPRIGGIMTNSFLGKLSDAGSGRITASWENIFEQVKTTVSSEQHRVSGMTELYRQIPYYEVSNTPRPVIRRDNNDNVRRVPPPVNSNEQLIKDLSKLLDKSIDESVRLKMVPNIQRRYFNAGGKVLTLGRDMTTIIDHEDANTFLRRICASPFIKHINVIEGADGKNDVITVHEVR